MIRVAIIGYSGAGRTTLANALAGVTCTPPIRDLDDLWTPLQGDDSVILDGLPRTVEECEQIDAKAPTGRGIDHVLYLQAAAEIRLDRVARMIVAGADPARARDRMLHPADLKRLRTHLEPTGRLTVIDASRSRSEVLVNALEILGIET
jgi:adenylate kinase family enzyme